MRSIEITLEDKPPKALPIYETPMARPQALLSLHIDSPWKAWSCSLSFVMINPRKRFLEQGFGGAQVEREAKGCVYRLGKIWA